MGIDTMSLRLYGFCMYACMCVCVCVYSDQTEQNHSSTVSETGFGCNAKLDRPQALPWGAGAGPC
jgi:hypothetical protein